MTEKKAKLSRRNFLLAVGAGAPRLPQRSSPRRARRPPLKRAKTSVPRPATKPAST